MQIQTSKPAILGYCDQEAMPCTSPEKADERLISICSRFVDPAERPAITREQLNIAFSKLYAFTSALARKEIGRLLAASLATPRPIAVRISMEPVEIGGKMLRTSPVLGQLDLLRIAKALGDAHCRTIARRKDLGAALARQLGVESDEIKLALKGIYKPRIDHPAFLPPASQLPEISIEA
jgi:hypothetical protein